MNRLLAPLVLVGGLCLAATGFWWIWTGLDIVQVERGWATVIAGATMLSGGLAMAAIAAVLARLGEIAVALGAGKAPHREGRAAPREKIASQKPSPTRSNSARSPVRPEAVATEEMLPGARQIVGRHTSGDATYVMFADGTVEAQTPEGMVTFPSLDALRAYADEREGADPEPSLMPDRRP